MSVSAADVERLNPSDKAELMQFINNESQRSKIQSQTHALTETCWKKCVTTVKSNSLDRSEETCLSNCVDRFWEVNNLTFKHLNSMRR